MIFLIIGVLYRIDIQLSQNWVSTVAPRCRCLLNKLRQSSIHTISKSASLPPFCPQTQDDPDESMMAAKQGVSMMHDLYAMHVCMMHVLCNK